MCVCSFVHVFTKTRGHCSLFFTVTQCKSQVLLPDWLAFESLRSMPLQPWSYNRSPCTSELSWLCSRSFAHGNSWRYYFKTPYLGFMFIFFSSQYPYFSHFLFPRYISYLSSDKIHSEFRFPGVVDWGYECFIYFWLRNFNRGFCNVYTSSYLCHQWISVPFYSFFQHFL